jgi:hypothetical protein
MSPARGLRLALPGVLAAAALALAAPVPTSLASSAEWRLEQPPPPQPAGGGSSTPIPLGHVGDIEFLQPNLGLLITAGNGQSIKPGVWAYNGAGWHELATECGATDGRIAWAGPEEFWTVSDGRPGQAANGQGLLPPLADNTLCHFARERNSQGEATSELQIIKSYASLAFSSSSYQPMDAAACASAANCWFAGAPLPAPQPGAFQLHWNGGSLLPEPNTKVESVGDMQVFEGGLQESIGLPLKPPSEEQTIEEALHPPVLYEVAPEGVLPQFKPLHPHSASKAILPEYACNEPACAKTSFPAALSFLRLSADEDALWAAAGPVASPPGESPPGKLTVLREHAGLWSQVLGPESEGKESRAIVPPGLAEDAVTSIAAEPGTASAWLALDTHEDLKAPSSTATALVVHVTAEGGLVEEELPTKQQREAGVGPKGAAAKIVCPAQNDCWLATTQGWLFHLSEAGQETLPLNPDPAINGPLITFRPRDEGLPQVPADTVPLETNQEHPPAVEALKSEPPKFATVTVPLITHLHARLRHGDMLELSFQLAVKARVRLVARRHRRVVASTPTRTLAAGRRRLLLRLDPRRWPTNLDLQTRALAPLPTISTRGSSVETVTSSLVLAGGSGLLGSGPRP